MEGDDSGESDMLWRTADDSEIEKRYHLITRNKMIGFIASQRINTRRAVVRTWHQVARVCKA